MVFFIFWVLLTALQCWILRNSVINWFNTVYAPMDYTLSSFEELRISKYLPYGYVFCVIPVIPIYYFFLLSSYEDTRIFSMTLRYTKPIR